MFVPKRQYVRTQSTASIENGNWKVLLVLGVALELPFKGPYCLFQGTRNEKYLPAKKKNCGYAAFFKTSDKLYVTIILRNRLILDRQGQIRCIPQELAG